MDIVCSPAGFFLVFCLFLKTSALKILPSNYSNLNTEICSRNREFTSGSKGSWQTDLVCVRVVFVFFVLSVRWYAVLSIAINTWASGKCARWVSCHVSYATDTLMQVTCPIMKRKMANAENCRECTQTYEQRSSGSKTTNIITFHKTAIESVGTVRGQLRLLCWDSKKMATTVDRCLLICRHALATVLITWM